MTGLCHPEAGLPAEESTFSQPRTDCPNPLRGKKNGNPLCNLRRGNTKRGRVNLLPEQPSTVNPKEEVPALFGRFLAPDPGFRKLC